ncbi:MAG: type II toxin-antitoxin system VapC family toxin [Caulobacteraceae bacterium]
MNGLLLDTHAILWAFGPERSSEAARMAVEKAWAASQVIFVSPISAWEVGILVAKGRLALAGPPLQWVQKVLTQPGVVLADMAPDVLIEASFLPGSLHGDPADRILVATARHHDLTLITRDRMLLAYAKAGHLRAVAC